MGEIEDNDPTLLYRPYIFLSRADGEWKITFDWDDSYQGYEDGYDFNPFTPADLGLRAYIEEGNDFLSGFLKKNAVWDVSVY